MVPETVQKGTPKSMRTPPKSLREQFGNPVSVLIKNHAECVDAEARLRDGRWDLFDQADVMGAVPHCLSFT